MRFGQVRNLQVEHCRADDDLPPAVSFYADELIEAHDVRKLIKYLQGWLRKYGNWKPPKKKARR